MVLRYAAFAPILAVVARSEAGAWSKLVVGKRESDVFVPQCTRPDGSAPPLILSLHAWAEDKGMAASIDELTHAEYIGPECAVLVYPQGKEHPYAKIPGWFPVGGYSWNAGGCCPGDNVEHVDDVGYLSEVITQTVKTYGANENDVFVIGVSNGGMMANRLACTDTRIKAIVSVAGPLINGTHDVNRSLDTFTCERRVPLLHFHGTADSIIPFSGCTAEDGSFICEFKMKTLVNDFPTRLAPIPEYIRDWRVRNGQDMNLPPAITFANGSSTNCTGWGSDAAKNVTLCIVGGQGHAWPGKCGIANKLVPGCACSMAMDATGHAMTFLRRYMLPFGSVVV